MKLSKTILLLGMCLFLIGLVACSGTENSTASLSGETKSDTQEERSTDSNSNTSTNNQPTETRSNTQEESSMNSNSRTPSDNKITIRIGENAFTVDLYDNPTANDLMSRLPLTLEVNNYPGYDEKVVRLSNPLSMKGAPRGDEPEIPEVGYYEPGQWIALYYGYIGYWPGKVPLGRINASIDELRAIPDNASVTIEIVKD
ncbi:MULTISPECIES: cyclophilin-like fold protein [Robertmurraya]|uniref:Cyclophilin-like fold protein n=1 Tax=Robertmurraya beringensis TaxID=641660 RepID=A0ABV6KNP7_9BACI